MKPIIVRQDPDYLNRYKIVSTEISCWNHFLYSYESKSFNYAIKRWMRTTEEDTITEGWEDGDTFYIHKGFAIYIYNTCKDFLDDEGRKLLEHDIYCDDGLVDRIDYEGLREDQESLLRELLNYRRGIVQVNTGFGKTEIIARFLINANRLGLKVLVTTGISKVIGEIKLRVWKYDPDVYLPDYWDSEAKINLVFPQGFCRSYSYDENDPWFDDVDIVLSDEVSGATTESAWACYLPIKNPDCRWYGFDATAEKELADRLDIRENLNCIHSINSVWVIDFFGMSWIFDKPKDYDVDIIEVSNIGLREINEGLNENISSETSIYRDVCNYIFSHIEYKKVIGYILSNYGKLFIPINDLTYIDTISDLFGTDYHVCTITGDGYWSSKLGWIDLEIFKDLTSENKVDLVLSSASGFKGLDFRGIPNVLLTLGVKASQVIQFVGRVARQKHFRVFSITAGGTWKLPIYTKQTIQQLSLIMKYYENCRITVSEDKYE